MTEKIPSVMTSIRVFCVFNSKLFVLPFPSSEYGWVHKVHHSQHRWFNDDLVISLRHTTCSRAVFPKGICRSCINKKRWRSKCERPCDTFYMHCLGDIKTANALLMSMALCEEAISEQQVYVFQQAAPKMSQIARCSSAPLLTVSSPILDPEERIMAQTQYRSKSSLDLSNVLEHASNEALLDLFVGDMCRDLTMKPTMDAYDAVLNIFLNRKFLTPSDVVNIDINHEFGHGFGMRASEPLGKLFHKHGASIDENQTQLLLRSPLQSWLSTIKKTSPFTLQFIFHTYADEDVRRLHDRQRECAGQCATNIGRLSGSSSARDACVVFATRRALRLSSEVQQKPFI